MGMGNTWELYTVNPPVSHSGRQDTFPRALLNIPDMHESYIDQHKPGIENCECTL